MDRGAEILEICCFVEAEDADRAVGSTSENVRLALNHGGIGTPSWPGAGPPNWTMHFLEPRWEQLAAA